MQYTHRKLHRSVTEIRRSWSGRARVSRSGITEKYEARWARSGGRQPADMGRDRSWLRKAAVALHRVHELVADAHLEGAIDEWNEHDGREPLPELDHQRASEVGGLVLVSALGAVGDADA